MKNNYPANDKKSTKNLAKIIDFAGIKTAALAACPGLLETLLPGGKNQGQEYTLNRQ